jgi:hypothetical protein
MIACNHCSRNESDALPMTCVKELVAVGQEGETKFKTRKEFALCGECLELLKSVLRDFLNEYDLEIV